MISYLKGQIIDKNKNSIVLDVNNVGYKVFLTSELLSEAVLGETKEIFIFTSVREDDISLFGFKDKKDLEFFKLLISVNGIGPKTALEIMSTPRNIVIKGIIEGDAKLLTKIKGIGMKTAERIILELKNKIGEEDYVGDKRGIGVTNDAVLALSTLGFERYLILRELSALPSSIKRTEDIVKWFLQKI